jgi:Raf kinase inhibitor-like YbhB/YbcL family protein
VQIHQRIDRLKRGREERTMTIWLPYENLPPAPTFTLTSSAFTDSERLPLAQASGRFGAGGNDESPDLSWSGFASETKSFVLTMLDPDAPTVTGIWHWAVVNIPGNVTRLDAGAGHENAASLPAGALTLRNDVGEAAYLGAAPPVGHGPHRYIFCLHALNTAALDVEPTTSVPFTMFMLLEHTVGRAFLSGIYEQ